MKKYTHDDKSERPSSKDALRHSVGIEGNPEVENKITGDILDDMIARDNKDYSDHSILPKISRILKIAARVLSDRQLSIFLSRYNFNMSISEIAKTNKITVQQVNKVLKTCEKKIQNYAKSEDI